MNSATLDGIQGERPDVPRRLLYAEGLEVLHENEPDRSGEIASNWLRSARVVTSGR